MRSSTGFLVVSATAGWSQIEDPWLILLEGLIVVGIRTVRFIGRLGGHLRACPATSDWCQVQVGDYRGFIKRSQFWGTLPGEAVAN